MRGRNLFWAGVVAAVFLFSLNTKVYGFIVINEILADPPAREAGDANGDGVRSASNDEFIELFNQSEEAIDVSDWYLSDATKVRHVFSVQSIIRPLATFVIFGGGSPQLTNASFQIALSGGLGLNNSGDTVSLFDFNGQLIDSVAYGAEAGKDQSIVRSPEGYGDDFIQHLFLPEADGMVFSPGYFVNPIETQKPPGEIVDNPDINEPSNAVVPEIATIYYFGITVPFLLSLLGRKQS